MEEKKLNFGSLLFLCSYKLTLLIVFKAGVSVSLTSL